MMSNDDNSYKSIIRNMSKIGIAQIANTLFSILKGKFAALFLGSYGMGIMSLLISQLDLIKSLTGFGLEISAVKRISEISKESKDIRGNEIKHIRFLFIISGLIGAVTSFIFADLFSHWSFNNEEYVYAFRFFSITIFFYALFAGNITVMRGLGLVTKLVKTSILTSFMSMLISSFLFFYYKTQGIVVSMVVVPIISYIISECYLSKKVSNEISLKFKYLKKESISLLAMGVVITIGTIIGSFVKLGVNVYIGRIGSISDVGFFTAAVTIGIQYVKILSASLSDDYYPRLSKINRDINKVNKLLNKQLTLSVLIIAPLIIFAMLTAPIIIEIFLSKEFDLIVDLVRYISLGTLFQIISYNLGYISLAKQDKKFYLLTEVVISNILLAFFSLLFYYLFGLNGLGIAYISLYIVYLIIITILNYKRYRVRIEKKLMFHFSIALILTVLSFIFFILVSFQLNVVVVILLFILQLCYSLYFLNRYFNFMSLLKY